MRLMFLADRIWGTSAYSKVMYNTAKQLSLLGHQLAHIPMGLSMRGGKFNYEGVLVYPSGNQPFGEDVAIPHYVDYKADMLITIKDVWVFNEIFKYAVNFCPMVPIDHSPVSPSVTARLHTTFRNIAISRHGQRELSMKGVPSVYIPHGVDTNMYKRLENHMADCRDMFFLDPDEFVVGIVAMNRSRKMIPRMLRGYKRFLELNPDVKSHLMLWTKLKPTVGMEPDVTDTSVNLLPEIMDLGLGEAVRWPEPKLIKQGLPEWVGEDYKGGWDMVKLYNCFDVLLMCTGGEGFSLPLIEAQAVGCPVVTTDYAAAPEIVGAGLTVRPSDYIILNTPGTRYALASIDGMAEALTKILNANREKLARRARKFAERYDWRKIAEQYWKPFLEECETELHPLVKDEGVSSWV